MFNTILYNEPSYFIKVKGYKEWILQAKVRLPAPGIQQAECLIKEGYSASFHTSLEKFSPVGCMSVWASPGLRLTGRTGPCHGPAGTLVGSPVH